MQPKTAAQVKTADALGGIDEQAESHQQRAKWQLPVRERGSAGHRELSVAGFAFEQATRPIGVDGRAAAIWTDRRAVGMGHRIAQSILCAASSDRSHRSTSDSVLAAADMRKCCATPPVQEKGHGFLRYSDADVDRKYLIPLLGVNAP